MRHLDDAPTSLDSGGMILGEVKANTVSMGAEFGSGRDDNACLMPQQPDEILQAHREGRQRWKEIASGLRRAGLKTATSEHLEQLVPDGLMQPNALIHPALWLIEPGSEYRLVVTCSAQ